MYIRMYGLPAYNEIDPTIFVAITYSLIFGAMFGDAGQGLCLLIGGFLLYKFKKIDLAAIISCAGFFSTIFGFLYGSFFGFEDVLPALWLKPMNQHDDRSVYRKTEYRLHRSSRFRYVPDPGGHDHAYHQRHQSP